MHCIIPFCITINLKKLSSTTVIQANQQSEVGETVCVYLIIQPCKSHCNKQASGVICHDPPPMPTDSFGLQLHIMYQCASFPIGSHAGRTMGSIVKTSIISCDTSFLSTTTSNTNSKNQSRLITR